MFKVNIDEEIDLYLVSEAFSARYEALAAENKDYLSEWLAWPRFCQTKEHFKQFVTNSLHKYADGEGMNCALVYRGEVVGNIGYNTINHDLKMVEMGYWIGRQYQGNGIVTRACQFLIDYAFTSLDIEKVQIAAAEDNLASRAVCERLGMTLEGIISNREKIGDRVLNHAVYGLHRGKA